MAKVKKDRMFSTSVQLSGKQFDTLEEIRVFIDAPSNAEVLRKAFDYYVQNQFPQFIEN